MRSRAPWGAFVVPDPAWLPEGYASTMADLARRLSVSVVLPGAEKGIVALAPRLDRFDDGIALGINPPDVVDRAMDKAALQDFATAAGLDAPATRAVDLQELERLGSIRFPAVIKPHRSEVPLADGTLVHCGSALAEDLGQARRALAKLPGGQGLLQEFIPGRLYAVGGVVWEGELIAGVHYSAQRLWPPVCGEVAHAVTVPPDEELDRLIADMLGTIGLNGIFQVQFVEADGRRYLIDLNARIFLSLALPIAAGANLPALWVELLLGRRPQKPKYEVGVHYRNERHEVRALARTAARGHVGAALAGARPRRRTAHALFSRWDPLPFLSLLGDPLFRLFT
jgi:carbamoyl-phosphate synthase large subunit